MMFRAPLCLTALLCLSLPATRSDFSLTLLHTNDVHARIEETDARSAPCTPEQAAGKNCFGGVARIRTMVEKKRAEHVNHTILLDAGDQFQGTLWFYQFGGIVSAQFMNLIRYDAMAVGNHEFDKGVEGLEPFAKNLSFPLLSSNMKLDNTPQLKNIIKKSTVLTVAGERIGVVGYTTPETAYSSSPGTVEFVQELAAVQAEVNNLTAQGINKIIALGHSGYSFDVELGKQLTNVDIIVGGHTHSFLYNGTGPSIETIEGVYPTVVTSKTGDTVLVVQDYAYGKYLGELNVVFDDAGKVKSWTGNPILLNGSVAQDNETMALINTYLPQVNAFKKTVVGESYVFLSTDKQVCRRAECNIGNVITDAMIQHNLRHSNGTWSDVAMAMVNGGGIRSSINIGNITTENVIFVQPFRNEVDIVEVTGQTLLDVFEYCASKWVNSTDSGFGGFLQVSGMRVTYNMDRPVGQRVHELLVTCTQCDIPRLENVQVDKHYKILAITFVIKGGDGYTVLKSNIINRIPLGDLDTDILISYVKKFSPITTGLQDRIRFVSNDVDNCKTTNVAIKHVYSSAIILFMSSILSVMLLL
ncbi:snake venom 5'-nucleotidase-like isoform X1 [Physella acuta]|uniref:snake venom 5'-nucleotidase-like isoform X1 n=1 Tax=Physella acuta TaxID=109671 RepID=UPI0027DADA86|nr:snake venom 5'-nucleotidase-like isoform X1 [Physella acuta]XP_059178707.1 snake venom 5'-nucleotidase-like isoform X1 [Physella acuta]